MHAHSTLTGPQCTLTPRRKFPNNYTLGKNLTEKLIAQFHA